MRVLHVGLSEDCVTVRRLQHNVVDECTPHATFSPITWQQHNTGAIVTLHVTRRTKTSSLPCDYFEAALSA